MANEVLIIPEENVMEVVAVIRAGLDVVPISNGTKDNLQKWCDDEEHYFND